MHENETLTGELNRLRTELERVQTAYETSLSEIRALKVQLDERFLVAANTPPVATVNLILFRFVFLNTNSFRTNHLN